MKNHIIILLEDGKPVGTILYDGWPLTDAIAPTPAPVPTPAPTPDPVASKPDPTPTPAPVLPAPVKPAKPSFVGDWLSQRGNNNIYQNLSGEGVLEQEDDKFYPRNKPGSVQLPAVFTLPEGYGWGQKPDDAWYIQKGLTGNPGPYALTGGRTVTDTPKSYDPNFYNPKTKA